MMSSFKIWNFLTFQRSSWILRSAEFHVRDIVWQTAKMDSAEKIPLEKSVCRLLLKNARGCHI